MSPFPSSEPNELWLRSLVPHVASMKRRHVAYIGTEDTVLAESIDQVRSRSQGPTLLEIQRVSGDHGTALEPSLLDFLSRIKADRN